MAEQARADARGVERAAVWLAGLVPFSVALARASGAPQWSADVGAVRDHGLAAVGPAGVLSMVATQAIDSLPVGSLAFRGALVSALAVGVAGSALAGLALVLVRRGAPGAGSWLAAACALLAALGVALGPTFQREATAGGGVMVAVAAALVALHGLARLADDGAATLRPEATRGWLVLAALAGATFAESVPAGAAIVLVTVVVLALGGKRPPARLAVASGAVAIVTVAVAWAPVVLRAASPRSSSDLGRALAEASFEPAAIAHAGRTAIGRWSSEMGIVALALGVLGVGVAASGRGVVRGLGAGLGALALAEMLVAHASPSLAPDPVAPLSLLGLSTLSLGAALGVARVATLLGRLGGAPARAGVALLVVFHATGVAVTAEEAAFVADRRRHFAAEAWTDAALGGLPPRAAVVVSSEELGWRLWSARLARGERPDVVVVSLPMAQRGELTSHLLSAEPELRPLLRDAALGGRASEYALGILADARPLYVELDPRWGKRLLGHLGVEGAWLRFRAETLGPGDRPVSGHALGREGRIARALAGAGGSDTPSRAVVARTLKQHAALSSLVGLHAPAVALIDELDELRPHDPFVTGARLRLAHAARARDPDAARVELRDLLRF
jgi:hypothetical protein